VKAWQVGSRILFHVPIDCDGEPDVRLYSIRCLSPELARKFNAVEIVPRADWLRSQDVGPSVVVGRTVHLVWSGAAWESGAMTMIADRAVEGHYADAVEVRAAIYALLRSNDELASTS
jgi:hypothetical protein